jgi:hypothetical protein
MVVLSCIGLEGAWGSVRYINYPPYRWRGCWVAVHDSELPVKAVEKDESPVLVKHKLRGSRGRRKGTMRARGQQPRSMIVPESVEPRRKKDPRSRNQRRADSWVLGQLVKYALRVDQEMDVRRKVVEERAKQRDRCLRLGGSGAKFDRENKIPFRYRPTTKVCAGRRKSIERRAALMRRQLEPGTFKNFRRLYSKGLSVLPDKSLLKIRASASPQLVKSDADKLRVNTSVSVPLYRGDAFGVPGGAGQDCRWRSAAEPGCYCRFCRALRKEITKKHGPRGGANHGGKSTRDSRR